MITRNEQFYRCALAELKAYLDMFLDGSLSFGDA